MTTIIDTHCHYNMNPLYEDFQKHWKNASDSGVQAAITVGTDLENSKIALDLSGKYPQIYASIGIHPENATQAIKKLLVGDKYSQDEINDLINKDLNNFELILKNALVGHSKLVAIGEIGLDYYRLKTKGLKRDLVVDMQKKLFEEQLKLAFKNNLVAIIHVRDLEEREKDNAYLDVLEILKNYPLKFVLHCVSGPILYIKEALELGAYIGIAGNVTYDSSQNIREIIKITPPEKLLIETDAPYLIPKAMQTPKSNNNQFCEPFMIQSTAKYLHQEMGINLDIIKQNSEKLFF